MYKQFIEPSDDFLQAVIIKTGTCKTIYISGQIGTGATLELQTSAAFKNLEQQLHNCNATFKDVVKMTPYIVNFHPDIALLIYRKIRKKFLGGENYPASTLLGVTI